MGQVEPGPEAEALLAAITQGLLALRDPRDGRTQLIDSVLRGDQLFWGAQAEQAPDLIVVPHEYRWMTRAGCEIGPPGVLVAPPAVDHTGNHRMNGIGVAGGPGIGAHEGLPIQRLLDLCPTSLALLGMEVPRGLDGRPMEALLSCEVAWTDDLPWREPWAADSDGADRTAASGSDPRGLEEQLRGLGYLSD